MYRMPMLLLAATFLALGQSAGPNAILGAGYIVPTPVKVAPGQVITLFVSGNLPTSSSGIAVTVHQGSDLAAPILHVSPVATCDGCGAITAITIQIPSTISTGCPPTAPVCPTYLIETELFVTVNGVAGTPITLNPVNDQVHIVTVCDPVVSGSGIVPFGGFPCQPLVTHGDGTLVSNSSPASVGEELVAYVVGLGLTNTAGTTTQQFTLDYNFHSNALPSQPAGVPHPVPLYTGLTPGYPGLYQINFIVPPVQAGSLPCAAGISPPPPIGLVNTNLTVSVGGSASFDGAAICVAL
jgi:uncharacterized protein (TIGR03437 family)